MTRTTEYNCEPCETCGCDERLSDSETGEVFCRGCGTILQYFYSTEEEDEE